jgi:arylsulfatase A-like enzyme
VLSLAGCGGRDERPGEPLLGSNVLLITLDTTRADALSCYSGKGATTPHLDELARSGVRFARAYTSAPLTLPAHATILTGRYPPEHGARDNGTFVVSGNEVTLAECLKNAGYQTAAVIAAPVLEHSFGLAQGFDDYDDRGMLSAAQGAVATSVERHATEITDRALGWLGQHGSQRFFLWAHYFDPHQPWEAPEPFKSRFERPYDAEVAYMDEQVGRLVSAVRALPHSAPTLIVVVADHGESLGAHDEKSHGLFLYEETVRVPLIIAHPSLAHGAVRDDLVRTADLMPTVAALLGFAPPAHLSGVSLAPLLVPEGGTLSQPEAELAYFETSMPYTSFDLSPLFALATARFKFIWAPKEELYDLTTDPHEERNLVTEQTERVSGMRSRLEAILARSGQESERVQPGSSMQQALAGLGYAGTIARAVVEHPKGDDPKDHVAIVGGYSHAYTLFLAGKFDEARDLLKQLTTDCPASYLLLQLYGTVLGRLGRHQEAIAPLARSIEIEPNQPETLINLALASFFTNDRAKAEKYLVEALKIQPLHPRAVLMLAEMYATTNRVEQAKQTLREFLDKCGQVPERAPAEQMLARLSRG